MSTPFLHKGGRLELARWEMPKGSTPVAPDADIEYLEINRLWERNTRAGRTRGTERARLHGVSPQLPEKIDDEAWTSLHGGTRRHVPIAFSSPMVLVDLPLRINPLVIVAEADPSASRCGHVLEEVLAPDVTLGQVLHAIVSDLTTHGRPALSEAELADPVDAALAKNRNRCLPTPSSGAAPLHPDRVSAPGCIDAVRDQRQAPETGAGQAGGSTGRLH